MIQLFMQFAQTQMGLIVGLLLVATVLVLGICDLLCNDENDIYEEA